MFVVVQKKGRCVGCCQCCYKWGDPHTCALYNAMDVSWMYRSKITDSSPFSNESSQNNHSIVTKGKPSSKLQVDFQSSVSFYRKTPRDLEIKVPSPNLARRCLELAVKELHP